MPPKTENGAQKPPLEFHQDRDLGFLSKGDWDFLLGEIEILDEPDAGKEGVSEKGLRQRKYRMRKKIRRVLLDFTLLYQSSTGQQLFRDVLSDLSDETDSGLLTDEDPHLLGALHDLQGLLFLSSILRNDNTQLYEDLVKDAPRKAVSHHLTDEDEIPVISTAFALENWGAVPVSEVKEQFESGELLSLDVAKTLYQKGEISREQMEEFLEEIEGKEDLVAYADQHPMVSPLSTREEIEEELQIN